jgi:uncharacterized repeat protein (TIGR03803 family)
VGIWCLQSNRFSASMPIIGVCALISAAVGARHAAAEQEKVLYNFCAQAGCIDGDVPNGAIVMDGSGHLYGTTAYGGAHQTGPDNSYGGAVFELTPRTTKNGWKYKVVYSFCAQGTSTEPCTDGLSPQAAGLVIDKSGNLYGTTTFGGANLEGGTVFELIPNAAKTAWTETAIYSFCAQGGNACTDGAYPYDGLIADPSGNLYGTTSGGGSGNGTVFELTPNATKTAWTETVLYSFCAQTNCTDGAHPNGNLIMDGSGNIYGTTALGGRPGDINGATPGGTVFELIPNAAKTILDLCGTLWFLYENELCRRG